MAKITGFSDIDRKLSKLEGPVMRRILRKTLMLALQPWLTRTRAGTPKRTGALARLIRITAGRSRGGRVTAYFSLAGRKLKRKAKAVKSGGSGSAPVESPKARFYGSFVEAGRKGQGFMKAKYLEMKGKIRRTVGDILWVEIEQEMKK